MNRVKVKGRDHSSAVSASSNPPPTAEEIAVGQQSSPEASLHQLAATFLETGMDIEESSQSKSEWLPAVSVIVEHILPLLDRVSVTRYDN